MLNGSLQPGSASHAERGRDLYETPRVAVEALLRVEKLPLRLWEPAAGRLAIVRVLRDAGHIVTASDIVDLGGLDFIGDFYAQTKAPAGIKAIITNPPYLQPHKFIAHALDLCPQVIALAPVSFFGSVVRTAILEHRGLVRVHVFRERLPRMHRDGWAGRRTTSAVYFAWFCWEAGHRGPPTVHRLSARNTGRAPR